MVTWMIQHIHSIHSLSLANWLTLWTLFTWLPISILSCSEDVKSSVRYKCKKGEGRFRQSKFFHSLNYIKASWIRIYEQYKCSNSVKQHCGDLTMNGLQDSRPLGTGPPTLLQRIKTSSSRTHEPQLRCSRAVLCLTGAALCFDLNAGYHFLAVLSHFVCFFCSFYVPL